MREARAKVIYLCSTLNRLGPPARSRRWCGSYHATVLREPFDAKQLEYLARVAGHAHEVFARAIEHMNRTGAGHELYEPIKQAMSAVGAIGVHVHYIKCDAARRAREAVEHAPASATNGDLNPPDRARV